MDNKTTNMIVELDAKVDEFVRMYCYKLEHESMEEYEDKASKLITAIEKAAIWFETISSEESSTTKINISESFAKFLHSLPEEERKFFIPPTWPSMILISSSKEYIRLNGQGYILDDGVTSKQALLGYHIRYAEQILKDYYKENFGYEYRMKPRIIDAIKQHDDAKSLYGFLFDAIMFRIIERGGCENGPIRALSFAQAFNRDISVPIRYGMDDSNSRIVELMENYINLGGNLDINYFKNYFSSRDSALNDQISLRETYERFISLRDMHSFKNDDDIISLLQIAMNTSLSMNETDEINRL